MYPVTEKPKNTPSKRWSIRLLEGLLVCDRSGDGRRTFDSGCRAKC